MNTSPGVTAPTGPERLVLERAEVAHVRRHHRSSLDLGDAEDLPVARAPQIRPFPDGLDVTAAITEAPGDGGSEHLVEQQPHPRRSAA